MYKIQSLKDEEVASHFPQHQTVLSHVIQSSAQ